MKHPSKSATGLKVTVLLLSVHTIMAAAIVAPVLPDIAHVFADIPNADLLAKLVLSLPAIFIAVTAPIAGRYIDLHGRIRVLYGGLLLYAVAGSSGFFLDDLYQILLGRMLLGVAIAIILTVAITLIGDYFEGEERKRFIGVQSAFIGGAGILFLGLGGILGDISWRTPFLIYALALLVIPLVFRFLPEPPKPPKVRTTSPRINVLILIIFITAIAFMALFYVIPTQLPFVLRASGVQGNSLSGLALAGNAIGAVLGSMAYARLRRRLSFPSAYTLGFALMATGYAMTGSADAYLSILLAMILSGLGLGVVIPNTNLWIIELTRPAYRGRNLGTLNSFMFLGQFLSPLLVEPIVRRYELSYLFSFCAILLASVAIAYVVFASRLIAMDRLSTRVLRKASTPSTSEDP